VSERVENVNHDTRRHSERKKGKGKKVSKIPWFVSKLDNRIKTKNNRGKICAPPRHLGRELVVLSKDQDMQRSEVDSLLAGKKYLKAKRGFTRVALYRFGNGGAEKTLAKKRKKGIGEGEKDR